MMIALIIVAVVAAFAFGVGGYLFFAACGRGKQPDWLDKASVDKTPYGRFYEVIALGHQWLTQHNAQDLYMVSRDGLRLHALWVPAENPKGTIIMAHGYRSCYLVDFSAVYALYQEQGMNILLPDQRAHGESQGRFITFGVLESEDFLDWGKMVNERFGPLPMFYTGLSMGASTVMYLAGQTLPQNVRGIIADCGFTSPAEIISRVFRRTTHLPAWPFLWATELFARFFGGFSLYGKHTTQTLAKNTLPMILVHGLDDHFVPWEMTQRSFDACGGEKELLLVEGAGHGVSFLVATEKYQALVKAFLEKHLEESL